jgi:hypothetical protein
VAVFRAAALRETAITMLPRVAASRFTTSRPMPRDAPVTTISIFLIAERTKIAYISFRFRMIRIPIVLVLLCGLLHAQTDSVFYGSDSVPPRRERKFWHPPWRDNVTFGGNFQLWFGNPTFIVLAPTAGYSVTRNLNVGVGGIYNYTSVNFGQYGRFSQSIFGGHSYARYIIAQSYFAQAQFDLLRQPDWYTIEPDDKVWVDYVLVGGGFRQAIGSRAALLTTIMYNLTPHPLSIYRDRVIIQFGFVAGL